MGTIITLLVLALIDFYCVRVHGEHISKAIEKKSTSAKKQPVAPSSLVAIAPTTQ